MFNCKLQLPLPRDQFQLISIKSESFYQRTLLFTTSEVSRSSAINRPFLKSPNSNDGVQVHSRNQLQFGFSSFFNIQFI